MPRLSRSKKVLESLLCGLIFSTGFSGASLGARTVSWQMVAVTSPPPPRTEHAMAFDEARGQVVLFGGIGTSGNYLGDTWVWDGAKWLQESTPAAPSPRAGHGMAYDAARRQVVLFGGGNLNGSAVYNDTWVWDGSQWIPKTVSSAPPRRTYNAMAWDSVRNQVVLFGGFDGAYTTYNDTWTWDGSSWQRKSPANSPEARAGHSMAFDSSLSEVILYGGSGSSNFSDTWTWNGANWTRKAAGAPSGRFWAGLAYDASRAEAVLFGGSNDISDLSDTWVWDGGSWIQMSPQQAPTPRTGCGMAYDSIRKQLFLFGGGLSSTEAVYNDTWIWNGGTIPPPTVTSVAPTSGLAGTSLPIVEVNGNSFRGTSIVAFSVSGVKVDSYLSRTADRIRVAISIAAGTPSVLCDVTVTNPDGQASKLAGGFIIGFPPAGLISTVAGGGYVTSDGGAATSAVLNYPRGTAVDAAGNLLIVETSLHRIRRVSPSGTISTIAGIGTEGFGGDGGPAASARLKFPHGVAVDRAGNIYIADWGNCRIRKVTPGGVISTIAGNGVNGFSGDGGPASAATLGNPVSIAVDGVGNVLFADPGNRRVRRITPGGLITTVAGGGSNTGDGGPATSAFLDPQGVCVDTVGNFYIADYTSNRVRKITPAGTISTLAGNGDPRGGFSGDGGPAVSAQLQAPVSVAVDTGGDLFIADWANHRIRRVTPGGIISTAAGNGTYGFGGDGGPATSANLAYPTGVTADAAGNLVIADSNNNRVRRVSVGSSIKVNLSLNAGASTFATTPGYNRSIQTGYATATLSSGAAPYGTALFSFKQNGVTVSETGVPASPPTLAARVFIDYRSAVAAIPGRIGAGTVSVNTGIAVVNYNAAITGLTYTLRGSSGATLAVGHGNLMPGTHFAKFIDQLKDVAPDFVLPPNFQVANQFASLEITGDHPVSILALRMTTNQRNDAIFTTTPTADLASPPGGDPAFFPQFADGDGYTTSVVLLNTSNGTETGSMQILGDQGEPLVVGQVGGPPDSVFRYSIPKGGFFRFQTDGSATTTRVGWVKLAPDAGTSTPVGAGVFGYNPGGVLVTESGIPSSAATNHARIYVDMSGGHSTGLALANPASTGAAIAINAFLSDGVTGVGNAQGPLQIPANGHRARFANQFVAGLPEDFIGVLDIVSTTPVAALTMRSLSNERNDFLLATFPIADLTRGAPSPLIFPQLADGGGYVTQFFFIGAGSAGMTLRFTGDDGKTLPQGR